MRRQISFRALRDVKYDVENMGKIRAGRESPTLVILACGTGCCRCKRKEHTARSISCGSPAINPRFASPRQHENRQRDTAARSLPCVFSFDPSFNSTVLHDRPSVKLAPPGSFYEHESGDYTTNFIFSTRYPNRGSIGLAELSEVIVL